LSKIKESVMVNKKLEFIIIYLDRYGVWGRHWHLNGIWGRY